MPVASGAVLASKYRVVREIGEGGMGSVVLATHLELESSVAIKLLRKELATDRESVTRFSREALATASLGSPHVARIYDAGRLEDGQPYLVMEYLDGNDLGVELAKRGRIPWAEAVGWVIEACRGVADAHRRGIVHRDLKPANLFLARERERRIVKVLDFGISHMDLPEELRVTQTHTAFGTPLYMSPEAVRSAKLTDARTDVWALGVILYELVVGRPPFLGESATAVAVAVSIEGFVPASELVAEIPAGFDAIVGAALEKLPAKRYADAGALGRALEALLGGAAVGALAPSAALPAAPESASAAPMVAASAAAVSPPLTPRRRAARAAVLLVACILIGAALSLGIAALALRRPRDAARDAPSAAAPPSPEVATSQAAATPTAPADESAGARAAAPTSLAASPSSELAAPTRVASGAETATASTPAPPAPRPSSTAPTATAPPAPTGARPSQGTPPLHL